MNVTPEIIAALSLLLNAIVIIVGATWGLGRIASAVKAEVHDELAALRSRVENELEGLSRTFGEGLSAVREKVNAVELGSYKDFIRRDSFLDIMTRASSEMAAYRNAIEARLDRQEGKIDRLIESIGKK